MAYEYYVTPQEYEIAAKNGISNVLVDTRIRQLGWDKSKAIETPVRQRINRKLWKAVGERNGIHYKLMMSRINHLGWDPERAATQPISSAEAMASSAARASEANRKIAKEYISLALQNGIPYPTFHWRLQHGWGLELAATKPIMSASEKGSLGASRVRVKYGDINAPIFGARSDRGGDAKEM